MEFIMSIMKSTMLIFIGAIVLDANASQPLTHEQALRAEQANPSSRFYTSHGQGFPGDITAEISKFIAPLEFSCPPSPDADEVEFRGKKFKRDVDTRDFTPEQLSGAKALREYLKGGKHYSPNNLKLVRMAITTGFNGGPAKVMCVYTTQNLDVPEHERSIMGFQLRYFHEFSSQNIKLITAQVKVSGFSSHSHLVPKIDYDWLDSEVDRIGVEPITPETVISLKNPAGSSASASAAASAAASSSHASAPAR
jgi:hypothetical protein